MHLSVSASIGLNNLGAGLRLGLIDRCLGRFYVAGVLAHFMATSVFGTEFVAHLFDCPSRVCVLGHALEAFI